MADRPATKRTASSSPATRSRKEKSMSDATVVSINIAAGPDPIFEALTAPEHLTGWFAERAEVDMSRGVFAFWGKHTPGTPGQDPGQRLLHQAPGRELSFEWPLSGSITKVIVSLQPASGGTLLTVRHENPPKRAGGTSSLADFWCLTLQNLRAWVEEGAVASRPDFTLAPADEVRLAIETTASPETVFNGLLDPAQLNRWMAVSARVEPVIGGEYSMGWDESGGHPLKILELVPASRLSYSWADAGEQDTVVTWELDGSEGATRITLVHSGFDGRKPHGEYYSGWADFLVRLKYLSEQGDTWRGPVVVSVGSA
ncbi:MAG: hypothetical protein C0506_01505 [Anaerolinea sp.]|nr:hypothetical protein [Anaerolinea sp.]